MRVKQVNVAAFGRCHKIYLNKREMYIAGSISHAHRVRHKENLRYLASARMQRIIAAKIATAANAIQCVSVRNKRHTTSAIPAPQLAICNRPFWPANFRAA